MQIDKAGGGENLRPLILEVAEAARLVGEDPSQFTSSSDVNLADLDFPDSARSLANAGKASRSRTKLCLRHRNHFFK
jgi:hypothetical protein